MICDRALVHRADAKDLHPHGTGLLFGSRRARGRQRGASKFVTDCAANENTRSNQGTSRLAPSGSGWPGIG